MQLKTHVLRTLNLVSRLMALLFQTLSIAFNIAVAFAILIAISFVQSKSYVMLHPRFVNFFDVLQMNSIHYNLWCSLLFCQIPSFLFCQKFIIRPLSLPFFVQCLQCVFLLYVHLLRDQVNVSIGKTKIIDLCTTH